LITFDLNEEAILVIYACPIMQSVKSCLSPEDRNVRSVVEAAVQVAGDPPTYRLNCDQRAAKDLREWFARTAEILLLSRENQDRANGLVCHRAAQAIERVLMMNL
jgi:hypothetical protein